MSQSYSLRTLFQTIFEKFVSLNLFDSRSSDPTIHRREIYSSRLLIVLLISSIIILTLYTSISVQTKSETIKWPSQSIYENLLKQYPNTLQCPCENMLILYGKFVDIIPSLHQVCSSDFISQQWIDIVFEANTTFIWPMDIRTSMSAMWQLIRSLCQSATEAIDDALDQFADSKIISPTILSEELLKAKTKASLELMLQTTSGAWLRPLTTLQRTTQANGFMTGLLTNYVALQPGILTDETRFMYIWMNKYKLKGTNQICSCQSNGSCPIAAGLYLSKMNETYGTYDLNIIQPNVTLSGIVFDCLPMQTILISSLECFYNQLCMDILSSIYPEVFNISILNASFPSRFEPTTKIEFLIQELFVEKIFDNTIYEHYYLQCKPVYCTFTYSHRFDWIYVITTLIALLGGLYTTFHLTTPYLIDFILFLKKRRRSDQIEHPQNENTPIRTRLWKLLVKMKISVVELNFFRSNSDDLLPIRRGRIATRFYLIILVGTISVLVVYTFLSVRLINKTVQSPSVKEYEELREQYSDTLQCPCSVISITHGDFITLTPTFHQLCSSDFVKPWWYESIASYYELAPHLISSASSHFRTLAMFCDIANSTIVDARRRFSSTLFVKALVPARSLFDSETYALIDTFLSSTKAEFLNTMSLIDVVFDANQYISAMGTNIDLVQRNLSAFGLAGSESIKIVTSSTTATEEDNRLCYCVRNSSCNLESVFDEYGLTVEGVRSSGCFVMDMVLQSSLLCWYDFDCMTEIRTWFDFFGVPLPKNVTLLDPLLPSRFSLNSSIDTIINEIMVEQWNLTFSYEKFYQKCKPAHCSYSFEERTPIVYVVTTVIGLAGGLNIFLRLICPLIARLFLKCTMRTNLNGRTQIWINEQSIDNNDRIDRDRPNIWTRLRHNLTMFNLFDSGSTQIETIRHERFSTRLYAFFLLVSILIVVIYTTLSVEIASQSISILSQAEYEELVNSNFITLQCPCSQISIRHKEFTTMNAAFHQICSSNFVKDIWLDYLFGDSFWYKYHTSDLRVRGTAYFSLLSTLCKFSQTIIDTAVQQFLVEAFVSAQVTSESEFLSKMTEIIQVFETKTLTGLSHSLQLVRDVTHGNTLISSYFSNWYWWVKPNRTSMTLPTNPVIMNDGCSCATRSDCVASGGIYRSFSNIQYFAMPGWKVGCSPVETLLRSTLECLYNQTCIDTLMHYASTIEEVFPLPIKVEAMNSTMPSRFDTNAVIQEIADALFVEKWQINVSYASFYKQCAPSYCSYTFKRRNDLVYIISRVLGLYGGLTTSLRFIVPLIIKLAFKIRNYCRRNTIVSLA